MVVFQTKTEQNPLFSIPRRKAKIFTYGFLLAFVACTVYVAFFPSPLASPSFSGFFSSATYRSRFSSLLSRFFPQPTPDGFSGSLGESGFGSSQNGVSEKNMRGSGFGSNQNGGFEKNVNGSVLGQKQNDVFEKNVTGSGVGSLRSGGSEKNRSGSGIALQRSSDTRVFEKNQTKSVSASEQISVLFRNNSSSGSASKQSGVLPKNQTRTGSVSGGNGVSKKNSQESVSKDSATSVGISGGNRISNTSATRSKSSGSSSEESCNPDRKNRSWSVESMSSCDVFHGNWVKDDSYPLYPHGSCPHIDEPFNCYLNGRPDTSYQKLRWQPSGCNIPRLNATDMLERLRGKRLVFVGDSLNRNMWESLVCILRNSVNDKTKVFEASGRHEFRTEGSYSFLFKDYGCTVEFFRSPFLVQEWEIPETNGSKKETLRLDVIERSSSRYKDADVIIFNTGHWWTHEKTSKGKDYYQEGNKIYSELNVVEAFHKALNTWSKWIDTNINKKKTFVFFRGYSASHFRGGQWNSGGQCNSETEPIKNEKYLSTYPPKMSILESVLKGMKTPVSYLNITRMTDYRKDGHPSIYRKAKLTEAERRFPNRYQDCSHWCLPGVPDSWNELLYAQLLIKQNKKQYSVRERIVTHLH